ncbi:hypothetical protein C8R44DRAFT_643146 [Mycena epipterygia]|nr:hypothetical protein C8R44DRAFT_643146 [Mycena epipterygia]
MAEQDTIPPYNNRISLDSRRFSELPTYTLLEDETAAALPPSATPSVSAPPLASAPLTVDPKEFSYEIKNLRNKPWATLTLLGDPRLSRTTATFLGGSNITGSVKLSLQSRDPIKSIVVFVRGDLVTEGDPDERLNFFRLRKFLWKTEMGDPRAPSAPSGNANWEDRLQGEYHWPLSIEFPPLAAGPNGEQFRLPHSFVERFSRPSIEYYLGLRINRGRFRSDDMLTTQFGYFSMQQPGRPSPLRELAYRDNTNIPNPYSDPDGWHALEPVQIQGTIFGERFVDAKCTVFLAKPLCYTRATAIPCAMTIETDDTQAADILASVKSSALYLQRCVRCTFGSSSQEFSPCGQATWWPSEDAPSAWTQNSSQRHIMGEIHLRKDLAPSAAIKEFRVEYAVAVFAPAAVAFKPVSSGALGTQSVEIVTRFAPGPRPRLVTPPTYESNEAHVSRYYEELSGAGPRVGLGVKMWSTRGFKT